MTRGSRAPRLDLEKIAILLSSLSTNEKKWSPFRRQLKAAMAEIARLQAELDRERREHQRVAREYRLVLPAAETLHDHVRGHLNARSDKCVCPLCRSLVGYRSIIAARVAEHRAKSGEV